MPDVHIIARERLEAQRCRLLKPLIEDTPFKDPDFQIVQVDLDYLEFTTTNRKGKGCGLILPVLGLLFSIVIVMVTHAIQILKEKDSPSLD